MRGAQLNEAARRLARHESVVQPTVQGYLGRTTIEAYGSWPDDFEVLTLSGGPGFAVTAPTNAEGRKQHARELEQLVNLIREASGRISRGDVGVSPLAAEARNATPALATHQGSFLGRAIVEFWRDGDIRVAVETIDKLDSASTLRFATDCIHGAMKNLARTTSSA